MLNPFSITREPDPIIIISTLFTYLIFKYDLYLTSPKWLPNLNPSLSSSLVATESPKTVYNYSKRFYPFYPLLV